MLELVAELKKGDGGWLDKDIEVGGYQGVDRLRKTMGGYLLEKDAKKFIENNASKQYRISTHPDFVTYDRGNLLKHTDADVSELAKKYHDELPQYKSRGSLKAKTALLRLCPPLELTAHLDD